MAKKLKLPCVRFESGGVYSEQFSDIYFNPTDPVSEVEWVFLKGNGLQDRWPLPTGKLPAEQGLADQASLGPSSSGPNSLAQKNFVIAEMGFGSGLNFFVTLDYWLRVRQSSQRLHYISFEKYPLSIQQLFALYQSRFPQYLPYIETFQQCYPPMLEGQYLMAMESWGVDLHLIFGDAYSQIQATEFTADAWYLDGFAPKNNPDMWRHELYPLIAERSKKNTTLATFTAAGDVRRGLGAAGFKVEKAPGYGAKRDMLAAVMESAPVLDAANWQGSMPKAKPWFSASKQGRLAAKQAAGKIAVVGAGLAGTAITNRLVRSGANVTLFDTNPSVAGGASGNEVGVLFFRPGVDESLHNRLFEQAYHRSLCELNQLGDTIYKACGILQLAYTDRENAHHKAVLAQGAWGSDWIRYMSAAEASKYSGVNLAAGGLYFPKSGYFKPVLWCKTRIKMLLSLFPEQINLQFGRRVVSAKHLKHGGKDAEVGWHLVMDDNREEGPFEHLIIASAVQANELLGDVQFPIRAIRGQVSEVEPVGRTESEVQNLKTILCYDGYITPNFNQGQRQVFHMGSTFDPRETALELREQDHAKNLEKLDLALNLSRESKQSLFHAISGGRVGLRAQLPDYLPIVGPVPDVAYYMKAYDGLRYGRLKQAYPRAQYQSGLWVCAGFGAKGGTLSTLMADVLAHYIMGVPSPISRDLLSAIHPARFLVRDLKRNKAV